MVTKSKRIYVISFCCVLLFAANTSSQIKDAFGGAEIGDSYEGVVQKLKGKCSSQSVFIKSNPQFPLAAKTEKHVICRDFAIDGSVVKTVVFTLADNKVVFITARGNAVDTLTRKTTSKESEYLGYRIFRDETSFANVKSDIFTTLSEEGLHPNLFVWKNPYLEYGADYEYSYETTAKKPTFLQFGGEMSKLKPEFEKACPLMTVDENERVFLPTKPARQTQINCFGFEYAGFPRKIEAIFGDGILQMAWILTAAPEEARVNTALESAFGNSLFANDSWTAFDNWKVYLRKDKPEVLMISEELIPFYKPQITGR